MDLFFYREPEELEKAEEAQAPYQEAPAVATPGWGAEPMVGAAAPTPMEGFAQPAVDPTAVPMDQFQAPPAADPSLGAGWDAAPVAEGVVEQPAAPQPPQEVIPVETTGGGWDPAPEPQAASGGGWGDSSTQGAGGW